MHNRKRQRKMIIGSLLAIVFVMAVGYAAFSTNLNISGSGAISSNWNVKITNITSKDIVGGAGNKTAPTYSNTTATFSTTLQSPGDSITYDITVSNEGTIDAKLDDITLSNSNNPAITFITSGLVKGDSLLKGTSKVLSVKVIYNSSVTSQPDNLSANLTVTLDFAQKGVGSSGIVIDSNKLAANQLKALAVTSGNGLYADSVTSGRYIYRGTTVNNYITFNNETWRIISVEADGTLKIIRNEQISGGKQWDPKGARDSSTSTYCTSASDYGCNAWAATTNLVGMPSAFTQHYPKGNTTSDSTTYSGTVTQDASLNTYLNGTYYNSLTTTAQKQIVTGTFNVSTPGFYTDTETLEVDAEQEKQYRWQGKIALMTVTELLRASTDSGCTSLNVGYNSGSSSVCKNSNWLWPTFNASSYEWTISPYVTSALTRVWFVSSSGFVSSYNAIDALGVRPVVHLSSDITLGGSGTSSAPYQIN